VPNLCLNQKSDAQHAQKKCFGFWKPLFWFMILKSPFFGWGGGKDGLNDGVEWLGIGCHPTFPM